LWYLASPGPPQITQAQTNQQLLSLLTLTPLELKTPLELLTVELLLMVHGMQLAELAPLSLVGLA
jgi:hypothetical protein